MNILGKYVDVSILVNGQRVPIYSHAGRRFVAGEAGQRYSIEVRNLHFNRLEVVESIDGRDVLKDAAASLGSSGMVIRAYNTWHNAGWRLNDNEIAEFVFGDPSKSIAAQATGGTNQVGVIGIAAFTERSSWANSGTTTVYPGTGTYTVKGTGVYTRLSSADSTTAAVMDSSSVESTQAWSMASSPDLGTGMGARVQDSISHTSFDRSGLTPAEVIEIQYRSLQWLRDNGVIGNELTYPSAFPGSATGYEKYSR